MSRILFFLLCGAIPLMASAGVVFRVENDRLRAAVPAEDTLAVLCWNLENFFDWQDGGTGESDTEFSARGVRHWTRRKFEAKARAIGKTVAWSVGQGGRLPDVIAVQEVENGNVLRRLTEFSLLRKFGYEHVHFDSPDRRGIDVALLYRPSVLRLAGARPIPVRAVQGADSLRTRDILLAQLEDRKGRIWSFLVCHFPSKYGGGDSDWRREAAARRLREAVDSLVAAPSGSSVVASGEASFVGKVTVGNERIIALGDFNDIPQSPVFRILAAPLSSKPLREDSLSGNAESRLPLVNLAEPLSRQGSGSIRFEGRWQQIDMVFVPPALAPFCSLAVLHPPFLTRHDNVHSGDRPLRTFLGPRYEGGVSDHRPLLLLVCSP